MTLSLNEKFIDGFVSAEEIENMQPMVNTAHQLLKERSCPGSDFLGWMDLPVNYDREEYAAIQAAAEKIKKSCDVFVVIGIGGSYLGARAVIEFLKSPLYNNLPKNTPEIYFAGNSISPTALNELLTEMGG